MINEQCTDSICLETEKIKSSIYAWDLDAFSLCLKFYIPLVF